MDIYKIIRELHAEKLRIDRIIASLEELQRSGYTSNTPIFSRRRGRKFMKADEREQVSARMKQYWARRRTNEKTDRNS
jgi:hypothetical protein